MSTLFALLENLDEKNRRIEEEMERSRRGQGGQGRNGSAVNGPPPGYQFHRAPVDGEPVHAAAIVIDDGDNDGKIDVRKDPLLSQHVVG